MVPLEIAKLYFTLSNKSDFRGIEKLFTNSTVYHSQTTGNYVGKQSILAMQRRFHGKFSTLNWSINSVKEIEPGVILFDYDFRAEMLDGEKVESTGLEYVTVTGGRIQRVEIRSKAK